MKQSRKEFIKRAHSAACNDWKKLIEAEFHELFKAEPEKGKWYYRDRELLVWNDGKPTYGFNNDGAWCDTMLFSAYVDLTPATNEEVETALIAEAKRRGFKNGNYTVCLRGFNNEEPAKINRKGFSYSAGKLWVGCDVHGDVLCIFCEGKWASIIEEEKTSKIDYERLKIVAELAEIKEKLNQIESKL